MPRILLFLPYAVPGVVAALMWGYIYGDKYGLVGQIFHMMGVQAPQHAVGTTHAVRYRKHLHLVLPWLQHADLLFCTDRHPERPV